MDTLIAIVAFAAFGAFVAWRKGWLTADTIEDIKDAIDGDDDTMEGGA